VPPASQFDDAFESTGRRGSACGGGSGGVFVSVGAETIFPLASSRLFFSVSSKSTRSLHCSSK
jgi:hypothetical protein